MCQNSCLAVYCITVFFFKAKSCLKNYNPRIPGQHGHCCQEVVVSSSSLGSRGSWGSSMFLSCFFSHRSLSSSACSSEIWSFRRWLLLLHRPPGLELLFWCLKCTGGSLWLSICRSVASTAFCCSLLFFIFWQGKREQIEESNRLIGTVVLNSRCCRHDIGSQSPCDCCGSRNYRQVLQ